MRRGCFIVATHAFWAGIAHKLKREGLSPALVCCPGRPGEIEEYPQSGLFYGFREAHRAIRPAQTPRPLPLATPEALVERLARVEVTALLVLSRRSHRVVPLWKVRERYMEMVAIWSGLYEALDPAALVMAEFPHMGFDYVAFAVAEELGIPIRFFRPTSLPGRVMLSSSIDDVPRPQVGGDAPAEEPAGLSPSWRRLEEALAANAEAVGRARHTASAIRKGLSIGNCLRPMINRTVLGRPFARRVSKETDFDEDGVPNYLFAARRVQSKFRRRGAVQAYDDLCKGWKLPEGPFVYFPLHAMPEGVVVPLGGYWANQMNTVQLLVQALPAGWSVVVKEHPAQFVDFFDWDLWRDEAFYRDLVRLENVKLAPWDFSSAELLERCAAVAAITGTAGWEAVQKGKPVLAFGHPWYGGAPGVTRVRSAEDCSAILSQLERPAPAAGTPGGLPEAVASYLAQMHDCHLVPGVANEAEYAIAAEMGVDATEPMASRLLASLGTA
jgi:hypothetical protein